MPFTSFSGDAAIRPVWIRLAILIGLGLAGESGLVLADTPASCPASFAPTASRDSKQALAAQLAKAPPCQLIQGVPKTSLASLWQMLTNGESTGGKRFDTPPPAGTPDGSYYAPQGTTIRFDFSSLQAQGLQRFVLADGGRVLMNISPVPSVQQIAGLRPGHAYHWELGGSHSSWHGDFQLMDPEDAREVTQRLQLITASSQPESVKQFYRAAVFDDEGLYANRDQILTQLRNGQ